MRRIAVGLTVLALCGGYGVAAAQQEECSFEPQWFGAPVRSGFAAISGERVLVQVPGEDLILDRAGAVELRRPAPARAFAELLPRAGGFWQIESDSMTVQVRSLDADGLAVGAALTLGSSIYTMNYADADAAHGMLAVAWTSPVAQFGSEFDIHLALLAADRTVVSRHVLPARAGAYSVQTVVQGDVVWLLWREDPFLRLLGQRFARTDGSALDAEPIEIGRGFNDVRWARVGDELRLYTDASAAAPMSFVLMSDGTVTSAPFTARRGWQVVGMDDGSVIHLHVEPRGSDSFPSDGAIGLTREDATGAVATLAELRGVDAIAIGDGTEVLVLSIEDAAAGDAGTSRLVLRRIAPGGAVGAATEVVRSELEQREVEVCTIPNACSAGGAGAAAWLPLLAALGLIARRRTTGRARVVAPIARVVSGSRPAP